MLDFSTPRLLCPLFYVFLYFYLFIFFFFFVLAPPPPSYKTTDCSFGFFHYTTKNKQIEIYFLSHLLLVLAVVRFSHTPQHTQAHTVIKTGGERKRNNLNLNKEVAKACRDFCVLPRVKQEKFVIHKNEAFVLNKFTDSFFFPFFFFWGTGIGLLLSGYIPSPSLATPDRFAIADSKREEPPISSSPLRTRTRMRSSEPTASGGIPTLSPHPLSSSSRSSGSSGAHLNNPIERLREASSERGNGSNDRSPPDTPTSLGAGHRPTHLLHVAPSSISPSSQDSTSGIISHMTSSSMSVGSPHPGPASSPSAGSGPSQHFVNSSSPAGASSRATQQQQQLLGGGVGPMNSISTSSTSNSMLHQSGMHAFSNTGPPHPNPVSISISPTSAGQQTPHQPSLEGRGSFSCGSPGVSGGLPSGLPPGNGSLSSASMSYQPTTGTTTHSTHPQHTSMNAWYAPPTSSSGMLHHGMLSGAHPSGGSSSHSASTPWRMTQLGASSNATSHATTVSSSGGGSPSAQASLLVRSGAGGSASTGASPYSAPVGPSRETASSQMNLVPTANSPRVPATTTGGGVPGGDLPGAGSSSRLDPGLAGSLVSLSTSLTTTTAVSGADAASSVTFPMGGATTPGTSGAMGPENSTSLSAHQQMHMNHPSPVKRQQQHVVHGHGMQTAAQQSNLGSTHPGGGVPNSSIPNISALSSANSSTTLWNAAGTASGEAPHQTAGLVSSSNTNGKSHTLEDSNQYVLRHPMLRKKAMAQAKATTTGVGGSLLAGVGALPNTSLSGSNPQTTTLSSSARAGLNSSYSSGRTGGAGPQGVLPQAVSLKTPSGRDASPGAHLHHSSSSSGLVPPPPPPGAGSSLAPPPRSSLASDPAPCISATSSLGGGERRLASSVYAAQTRSLTDGNALANTIPPTPHAAGSASLPNAPLLGAAGVQSLTMETRSAIHSTAGAARGMTMTGSPVLLPSPKNLHTSVRSSRTESQAAGTAPFASSLGGSGGGGGVNTSVASSQSQSGANRFRGSWRMTGLSSGSEPNTHPAASPAASPPAPPSGAGPGSSLPHPVLGGSLDSISNPTISTFAANSSVFDTTAQSSENSFPMPFLLGQHRPRAGGAGAGGASFSISHPHTSQGTSSTVPVPATASSTGVSAAGDAAGPPYRGGRALSHEHSPLPLPFGGSRSSSTKPLSPVLLHEVSTESEFSAGSAGAPHGGGGGGLLLLGSSTLGDGGPIKKYATAGTYEEVATPVDPDAPGAGPGPGGAFVASSLGAAPHVPSTVRTPQQHASGRRQHLGGASGWPPLEDLDTVKQGNSNSSSQTTPPPSNLHHQHQHQQHQQLMMMMGPNVPSPRAIRTHWASTTGAPLSSGGDSTAVGIEEEAGAGTQRYPTSPPPRTTPTQGWGSEEDTSGPPPTHPQQQPAASSSASHPQEAHSTRIGTVGPCTPCTENSASSYQRVSSSSRSPVQSSLQPAASNNSPTSAADAEAPLQASQQPLHAPTAPGSSNTSLASRSSSNLRHAPPPPLHLGPTPTPAAGPQLTSRAGTSPESRQPHSAPPRARRLAELQPPDPCDSSTPAMVPPSPGRRELNMPVLGASTAVPSSRAASGAVAGAHPGTLEWTAGLCGSGGAVAENNNHSAMEPAAGPAPPRTTEPATAGATSTPSHRSLSTGELAIGSTSESLPHPAGGEEGSVSVASGATGKRASGSHHSPSREASETTTTLGMTNDRAADRPAQHPSSMVPSENNTVLTTQTDRSTSSRTTTNTEEAPPSAGQPCETAVRFSAEPAVVVAPPPPPATTAAAGGARQRHTSQHRTPSSHHRQQSPAKEGSSKAAAFRRGEGNRSTTTTANAAAPAAKKRSSSPAHPHRRQVSTSPSRSRSKHRQRAPAPQNSASATRRSRGPTTSTSSPHYASGTAAKGSDKNDLPTSPLLSAVPEEQGSGKSGGSLVLKAPTPLPSLHTSSTSIPTEARAAAQAESDGAAVEDEKIGKDSPPPPPTGTANLPPSQTLLATTSAASSKSTFLTQESVPASGRQADPGAAPRRAKKRPPSLFSVSFPAPQGPAPASSGTVSPALAAEALLFASAGAAASGTQGLESSRGSEKVTRASSIVSGVAGAESSTASGLPFLHPGSFNPTTMGLETSPSPKHALGDATSASSACGALGASSGSGITLPYCMRSTGSPPHDSLPFHMLAEPSNHLSATASGGTANMTASNTNVSTGLEMPRVTAPESVSSTGAAPSSNSSRAMTGVQVLGGPQDGHPLRLPPARRHTVDALVRSFTAQQGGGEMGSLLIAGERAACCPPLRPSTYVSPTGPNSEVSGAFYMSPASPLVYQGGTLTSKRIRSMRVQLSEDRKTLIAGPFQVSREGCLTVENFLLLNPRSIKGSPQGQWMSASQTGAGAGGNLSITNVDGYSSPRLPGQLESPLLTPRLAGEGTTGSCGLPLGNHASNSTNAHSDGNNNNSSSTHSGGTQQPSHMPIASSRRPPHAGCETAAGSGGRRDDGEKGYSSSLSGGITPASQNPPQGHSFAAYANTCTNNPSSNLMMTGSAHTLGHGGGGNTVHTPLTMGAHAAHSGLRASSSFTLQSTSMDTPYSPITYSLDRPHQFPTPGQMRGSSELHLLRALREEDGPGGAPQQRSLLLPGGGASSMGDSNASPHHFMATNDTTSQRCTLRSLLNVRHFSPKFSTQVTPSEAGMNTAGSGMYSGGPAANGSPLPRSSVSSCMREAPMLSPGVVSPIVSPFTVSTPLRGRERENAAAAMNDTASPHFASFSMAQQQPFSQRNSFLDDLAASSTAGSLLLPYVDIPKKPVNHEICAVKTLPRNAVRYEDLELHIPVGTGASACVYVTIHKPTGRRLAVKHIDLSPLCLHLIQKPTGPSPAEPLEEAGDANWDHLFDRSASAVPLGERARQLELICVRELQVLHLAYRSPFMVKVYNAFFIEDPMALDIVMEFMHYGSLDHLAESLQTHEREQQKLRKEQEQQQQEKEGIHLAQQLLQRNHRLQSHNNTPHESIIAPPPGALSSSDLLFQPSDSGFSSVSGVGVARSSNVIGGDGKTCGNSTTSSTPSDMGGRQGGMQMQTFASQSGIPISSKQQLPSTASGNNTSLGMRHCAATMMSGVGESGVHRSHTRVSSFAVEEYKNQEEEPDLTQPQQLRAGIQPNFNFGQTQPPDLGGPMSSGQATGEWGGPSANQSGQYAATRIATMPYSQAQSLSDEATSTHSPQPPAPQHEENVSSSADPASQTMAHRSAAVLTPCGIIAETNGVNERLVAERQDVSQQRGGRSDSMQPHTTQPKLALPASSSATPHLLSGTPPPHQTLQRKVSLLNPAFNSRFHAASLSNTANAYSLPQPFMPSPQSAFSQAVMGSDCSGSSTGSDADDHCSGTDRYMSPERQRGEAHGKPSDIWAVGVTLAEFAVGQYPYNLEGCQDAFERGSRTNKVLDVTPFSAGRNVPLSSEFVDFVRQATAPRPQERPTAKELLEHPFFRQWDSPFNLKAYLAERVPVPSNAIKEDYLRRTAASSSEAAGAAAGREGMNPLRRGARSTSFTTANISGSTSGIIGFHFTGAQPPKELLLASTDIRRATQDRKQTTTTTTTTTTNKQQQKKKNKKKIDFTAERKRGTLSYRTFLHTS
eukprot:gene2176-1345_t